MKLERLFSYQVIISWENFGFFLSEDLFFWRFHFFLHDGWNIWGFHDSCFAFLRKLFNLLGKVTMSHTHTLFCCVFWFQGNDALWSVCITTKEKSCNYGDGGWWQHPSWKATLLCTLINVHTRFLPSFLQQKLWMITPLI